MTYAPIPNEDIDVGSPLTTALVTQLRDTGEYARFGYDAVSGATQALDLEEGQFFDAGTLTADTTVSFSNVPTEARWSYSFEQSGADLWDITEATYKQNFSVSAQDTTIWDLFFKPDGTKMYVIGAQNDRVYEYDLITAWDVSTASYLQLFSISAQELSPTALIFKDDGTKMYVMGLTGDDVNEYNLSTAWDVSTASYSQNFSVAAQDTGPQGLFFKHDGTKMYVAGNQNDRVYEYNLSTAWDVSTASYSQFFSLSTQMSFPQGLSFKSDGTKMYVIGANAVSIFEYDLSTGWDVSTASFLQSLNVSSEDSNVKGLFFKPEGDKMYYCGDTNNSIFQYDVGTVYALTLPASIENPPSETFGVSDRVTYDFFTADGGTTVTLIGEEVL